MITYKLYHRLRKFARGNIDFIEDFSLGHAEYPPSKWQSREAWGESANRRFVEGDEFHSSIASLGRLDSGYRVDVSGLPEAFFGLFS